VWQNIKYPFAETRALRDGMTIEVAGAAVTARKVSHTVECYALRIEKDGRCAVYYTDTVYLPENADFLRGADLLICEATISEGTRHSIGAGHMTDLEAGRTARDGGVKKLCLFHLPSDGNIPFMRNRAASVFGGPVVTPDQERCFVL
jgi:ribonuclease BN (tRNA processing enzyme)